MRPSIPLCLVKFPWFLKENWWGPKFHCVISKTISNTDFCRVFRLAFEKSHVVTEIYKAYFLSQIMRSHQFLEPLYVFFLDVNRLCVLVCEVIFWVCVLVIWCSTIFFKFCYGYLFFEIYCIDFCFLWFLSFLLLNQMAECFDGASMVCSF